VNTGSAVLDAARGGRLSPAVPQVARIMSAFAADDAAAFNDRVSHYRAWLVSSGLSSQVNKAGYESFYNVFLPFVRAVVVYGVGLILLAVAWRTRSQVAYRSARLLVLLAFVLQTVGLAFALELGGQPGFASFAGWAVALIALAAESFRRRGVSTAAAAAIGFVVLVLSFVFTPGGAASLGRNMLDVRLLAAMALTGAALGLAAVITRLSTPRTTLRQIRSYANYYVSRRSLRTE
jgi:hypothetical protein